MARKHICKSDIKNQAALLWKLEITEPIKQLKRTRYSYSNTTLRIPSKAKLTNSNSNHFTNKSKQKLCIEEQKQQKKRVKLDIHNIKLRPFLIQIYMYIYTCI